MKKTLAIMGILVLTLGVVGIAGAGEQCNKAAATKVASAEGSCNKSAASYAEDGHCASSAAKAAYEKCLSETGCEKTADAEYEKTATVVANEIAKHLAEAAEDESS